MRREVIALVGLVAVCGFGARAASSGRQTIADIEVRVDRQGRLALLIDEIDGSGRSDGFVD